MKFDIVQAWKDQVYRQSLDNEQIAALPANPAGELAETDLAAVYGGGVPLGIAGSAAARAVSEDIHIHSFSATTCDVNIFSALQTATLTGVVNLLSTLAQICANND